MSHIVDSDVDWFVDELAQANPGTLGSFENIYADLNGVHATNLRRYLSRMEGRGASTIIVGLSPKQGECLRTGVPLTDEAHLYMEPHDKYGRIIGAGAGYRNLHASSEIGHSRSVVSSTVWNGISSFKEPPLLWNALPFKPIHQLIIGDIPMSFRLRAEALWLWRLMGIFDIPWGRVYCLGRTVHRFYFPDDVHDTHYIHDPSQRRDMDFFFDLSAMPGAC